MHRHQRPDIAITAALPLPPKQLCCCALPFFIVEIGQGGQIIWQSGVVIFSENGNNTTLRT
jgi:hypothetical protein